MSYKIDFKNQELLIGAILSIFVTFFFINYSYNSSINTGLISKEAINIINQSWKSYSNPLFIKVLSNPLEFHNHPDSNLALNSFATSFISVIILICLFYRISKSLIYTSSMLFLLIANPNFLITHLKTPSVHYCMLFGILAFFVLTKIDLKNGKVKQNIVFYIIALMCTMTAMSINKEMIFMSPLIPMALLKKNNFDYKSIKSISITSILLTGSCFVILYLQLKTPLSLKILFRRIENLYYLEKPLIKLQLIIFSLILVTLFFYTRKIIKKYLTYSFIILTPTLLFAYVLVNNKIWTLRESSIFIYAPILIAFLFSTPIKSNSIFKIKDERILLLLLSPIFLINIILIKNNFEHLNNALLGRSRLHYKEISRVIYMNNLQGNIYMIPKKLKSTYRFKTLSLFSNINPIPTNKIPKSSKKSLIFIAPKKYWKDNSKYESLLNEIDNLRLERIQLEMKYGHLYKL